MLSNITMEPEILQELQDIAHRLRIHSITSTNAAKSGHPTSCASIAEIMSVLFFNVMRYYVAEPRNPVNDRIILSKGHAAPILYAAWAEAGLFPTTDLLNLRKFDSDLEGHPTPKLNFIDVGSGSLGQGVSIACGMSYVGKYIDKSSYRTYVIVGDGESAEGSIWEALHFASHYNLDNLCVIFDVNRLGQSEPTSLQHNIEIYRNRLDAFGWNAIVVDGHDVEELCKAFYEASITKDKPTAIVAKTFKGKHFPGIEDKENWHGKPLGAESDGVINHLKGLIHNMETIKIKPKEPLKNDVPNINIKNIKLGSLPNYGVGAEVSTRRAYGIALAKIGKTNNRVIALDGDTKNSTFSENLKKVCPDQFIECFIAEQNMVGVGIGTGCRERTIPFVSTFAAFFSRAYDQIRMGAISQANVKFVGSHCGVSIGEDGASQMALEDLTLFRTIPKCTIFYPSDAVSCERAVELAANKIGMCYIRTSRPDTRILYKEDEEFEIGRAKILKQCACDQVLLIGAGITIHEVLIAADKLREQQIYARVMDPFTIKPLDNSRVLFETLHCAGRVVVVEDHYSEGGLGEAVKAAVAGHSMVSLRHLAVSEIPHSGKPIELLNKYGLTVPHIIKAVRDVIRY